ncbi:PAS domain S-box protein [Sphingobium sp. AS12]|uniref:PAS domain S-box protein n=1 Tax=Sphingobium sp. AS12 TaxID=2849495 RepID=UPI001C31E7A4|nr:PAS domain S-box protein [Sphingobium sp. AS12]MBV2148962.1 PAS domain S-box protein [Sphingobium sp. AS12]
MNDLVLIFAPRGRDAAIAAGLLGRHAIAALICTDARDLTKRLDEGAGAVLLTEEALVGPNASEIAGWVAGQESWSDIPFVVLANGSRTPRTVAATERLAELGNVVLLERPLHAEAMLGAIRSSLKARARQFEVRDTARLSAAQNRILALAVEAAPLTITLDAIVREVEALSTSGMIGSILLLSEDGRQMRQGAGPSLPAAYNDAIDGIEVGPAVGSCGTAVYRREPVFVADISTDPLWVDFRDLALAHDLRACWSLPITSVEGEILGTFAMYHCEPREPVATDLAIVDFVVRTAGIVIARARAEDNLRASEARYRQIVEGAEDFAIVSLDPAGTITGWSSGATRLLGYSASEALGQTGGLFFTPEDRAANVPAREMARATAEGRAINERWHVCKDGHRFWGSGLTMPIAEQDGGYVTIFRDRTAEHEAEAALRESEARLRFFGALEERLFGAATADDAMLSAAEMLGRQIDASRCAYANVDADNDRFWIRNDYTAPSIATSAGTYSLNLFGPRAAAELRQGQTLIVREVAGELGPDEGRAMFQSIGIEAIVCCPLVKQGQLAAMMAVHQDVPRDWSASEITLIREVVERCWAHVERVGAEARLRESEERLRLAVENAEIGFWDVDVINDRLIWPAQTKAMFGISADVPVTMADFYVGLHPDDRDATSAAYLAAADPTQRALYDVDYRTIGKEDGVLRWVAAKGRGVFDVSGRCLRVAGTALDITARKQAEEALRDLNATLETRVAEAIAEREAAHEALRQSQKMEAMGQLTGGVAHDFNNLLTPIVGSLDMLQRKGVGTEREQRLIAGAAQSAERARVLVQRLLAFARRQPLQSVAVDIAQLVAGMGDLVESTTGPQIKVVVDAASDLPSAKADPNQLEMALLNLSVNARDAMPDGGTLRISATAKPVGANHRSGLPPGEYVRISVADTGSGMDEVTLARAIEPFFSTKGIGKGTGLGLSMVHGLASQLGGGLTIQSRPGMGTNIELWLPVSTTRVEEAPDHQRAAATAAHQGVALLVDDEELVRMSTADMLIELGYAIIEASSAEEALRLLDSGTPVDIVVTDHLMPGMTGTDLALRVQLARPQLPILLVSGYAELEGIDAKLPRLTKPFRKDELAATLTSLLH